jgi:hypothetical protein
MRAKAKSGPSLMLRVILLGPLLILVGVMQFRFNQRRLADDVELLPLRTIPCWNCEGKGAVRDPLDIRRHQPCGICFGVGSRLIRLDAASQEVCTTCSGFGFYRDEELELTTACPGCDGFGAMRKVSSTGLIRETRFDEPASAAPADPPAGPGSAVETP